MSIFKSIFEDVVEDDLLQLITAGQREGVQVEFKRDMYGSSDADKKEFLKDLSSFANSTGGQLVIGVDETEGVASRLSPIAGDSDAVLQRLEQIARNAIEPRIVGLQMRAVPVSQDGFVYLIRVPRSWNPPHRVSFGGSNKFFLRSSAGAHEASVEELRAVFANGTDMHQRMTSYIESRLSKIAYGEGVVPLAEGEGRDGKLVVQILPFAAFASNSQVNVGQAMALSSLLQPLGSSGDARVNFDGVLVVRHGVVAHGYTQVFRNGIVEATKVRVAVRDDRQFWRIPMRSFLEPIYQRIPAYLRAVQSLGVSPPFAISIALLGVQGSILGVSNDSWQLEDQHTIDRSSLVLSCPFKLFQTLEPMPNIGRL